MPETDRTSVRRPLLALLLLSPVLAEMLSGSSPPAEWLNPFGALLLIWLYGSGVVVVRETAVRWRIGYSGILLLGAAYGIIEEGLAVKSFFDPGWMDLGTLGWYGRWLDTNWVWAVWLTIYHAVVSITIPIFLVEWAWPSVRGRPLLSKRGYAASIGLLALATIFIDLALTPYRPSPVHLLGGLLAIAVLVWAAKGPAGRLFNRLPTGLALSRRAYAILGFAFIGLSFLIYAGGPFLGGVPIVTILEGGLLLLLTIFLARQISDGPQWARHRYAFVAGIVSFFIALAFFLELAGQRGMAIVGVAFAAMLVLLYRRAIPEDASDAASAAASFSEM